MPQAAGQVKILIFLVKIKKIPIYANIFCDAGQVPILRYFKAWSCLCVYLFQIETPESHIGVGIGLL